MSPIFSARIGVNVEGIVRDVLLIYWSFSGFNANAVASVITDSINNDLEPDIVLVITRQTSFDNGVKAFKEAAVMSQALDRLSGDCRVELVAFGLDGNETSRESFATGAISPNISLSSIRRPAITEIFRRRNGFIESTPNFHFENPSGKHTDRFIRLSNILSSQSEISFIAFAALSFIPRGCRIAYLDTPSLYPVIAAINDHRRDLDSQAPFLVADNFGSYDGARRYPFTDQQDSVALISASSSGSLGDYLINEKRFSPDHIVHVLYLGRHREDLHAIVDLEISRSENPAGIDKLPCDFRVGTCVLCDSGSFAIRLFGDQFDLPGPQLDPLVIAQKDAPEGLEPLIADFVGRPVFGVGLGVRDSIYPRLYNVDVAELFRTSRFIDRLEYIIRRTTPNHCEFIIHLDKHSKRMADEFGNNLALTGQSPRILTRDQLEEIPDGINSPVIIVAAVIESGRSLLDISRDLRRRCRSAPLVYVVGVNKTTGFSRREALRGNLSMTGAGAPHEVIFIDNIILPPSGDENAWSRELRIHRQILERGDLSGPMKTHFEGRIQTLRDVAKPLIDDLFLGVRPGARLEVQPGFVFAPAGSTDSYSQADVFFTLSSILQKLRSNAERLGAVRALRSNWFQQTALAPENFGRFNDGVIQASFLRAGTPAELNYSAKIDLSREMGRIATRIVASAQESRGEAAAEILLALASRQLTLRPDDARCVLDATPAALPVLKILSDAARKVIE